MSEVRIVDTASAWREITAAIKKQQVDWRLEVNKQITVDGEFVFYYPAGIDMITDFEEYDDRLHPILPGTVFKVGNSWERYDRTRKKPKENESYEEGLYNALRRNLRFSLPKSPKKAVGGSFQVEIMPDGRVAADGDNRFGACDVYDWQDICQISCGECHTVGLKADGTLIACGSNSNGQCEVSDLPGKAVAVSCGRFHTAILMEDGSVLIKGHLEQRVFIPWFTEEKNKFKPQFPRKVSLVIDKKYPDWEKMNENAEHLQIGDTVKIKKGNKDNNWVYCAYDSKDRVIGALKETDVRDLRDNPVWHPVWVFPCLIKGIVSTVEPLSKRKSGAKYAKVDLDLEYYDPYSIEAGPDAIGNYQQTAVKDWPKIKKLQSIYDAVIGLTEDGQILIDGYCPFTEQEIKEIMAKK